MNVHLTGHGYIGELVPQLEAEGYDVYLEPSKLLVPSFLGDFRPDALAIRPDKKLVIEIISNGEKKSAEEASIAGLFAGQKEWEHRLIVMNRANTGANPAVQEIRTIGDSVSNLNDLVEEGQYSAALLLGWATLEASGRFLMPDTFARPQTPARLVQELATEGVVTPAEAANLRTLAQKRNKLIHGDLTTKVSKSEIVKFLGILAELQKTNA
jgi:uncharacterized protein YutE (UPF0331/DUF86 family)